MSSYPSRLGPRIPGLTFRVASVIEAASHGSHVLVRNTPGRPACSASDLVEEFAAGELVVVGEDGGADQDAPQDLIVVQGGQSRDLVRGGVFGLPDPTRRAPARPPCRCRLAAAPS